MHISNKLKATCAITQPVPHQLRIQQVKQNHGYATFEWMWPRKWENLDKSPSVLISFQKEAKEKTDDA